jgi:hypothetical protein
LEAIFPAAPGEDSNLTRRGRRPEEQAFRYLERAYQEYDSRIFQMQDRSLDSLRDDPRWTALVRRLNLQDTPMTWLPAAPAWAAR